jgi:Phage integrase family
LAIRCANLSTEGEADSPYVVVSERGSPFTTAGFGRMIERAAAGAGLELKAHPHMLRHACGYALANKGHDTRAIQGWLGHRSITQHRRLHGAGAEPVQGLLERVIRYALHCPSGHGQSSALVLNLSSTSPRSSAVQKRGHRQRRREGWTGHQTRKSFFLFETNRWAVFYLTNGQCRL